MNKVFFIKNVNAENLQKLLLNLDLGFLQEGFFVALKTHFGEDKCENYVPAELYLPLIKILKQKKTFPFFTDTNTVYVGKRANAVEHLILAHTHGFKIELLGIPVIIADGLKGNDFVEVPINLKHFKTAKIASDIYHSDILICLTHFKGHMLFGFGGAIKNLGMGCAARPAKYLLHNVLKPKVKIENCTGCNVCIKYCPTEALTIDKNKKTILFNPEKCTGCAECIHVCKQKVFSIPWDLSDKQVQERTVEYAYAVVKNKKDKCLFINFLYNITKDCDCIPKKQSVEIKDIGIVAGYDPVSVDTASLYIVNDFCKKDLFKTFWPKIDYNVQLDYAEKIGLGKKSYSLVEI